MEFQLLEIKSPQQQMEVEKNEKRERGGKKIVEEGRNEEAQEQDRGGRQSKWQLHCK